MGRSLSLYGPVVLLEKLVTFGRVVLLTWLLGRSQYGVWALGVMVFSVFASLATLGSNESVARYVSYYHARGRLREFYRRAGVWICLLAAGTTGLGLLGSVLIADFLASSSGRILELSSDERLMVVLLGLANGVLMALYHNVQSCLRAMRTFRVLAVVDLAYTALFTGLALGGAAVLPSGHTILVAHAGSLAVMLVLGGYASHRAVAQLARMQEVEPQAPQEPPPQEVLVGGARGVADAKDAPMMARLLRFGLIAMIGPMLWQLGNQVSAWFVNRYHGPEALGLYAPFRQLCQPVWILSGILWGLIFSHVATHWESGLRQTALRMLDLTYKAVVLSLMTLSVLMLATSRWWSLILKAEYRGDLRLLGGLLTFFQCSANLGLASIAAKLRERPLVIVVMVGCGVGVNAGLAWLWVPQGGVVAAANAAGLGMLSACALGVVYLLFSGFKAHPATHVLALAPAALLLPEPYPAAVWLAFLGLTFLSPWILSRWEKQTLLGYISSLGGRRA
ncbi:MAG: hypothetical protein AMJ81_09710 [Phycisphaerae bacterium SM23_33]|nr:MAG: hypothetical protein AMJ81_09710 [Phycisphaerae bacterium SM23_33]